MKVLACIAIATVLVSTVKTVETEQVNLTLGTVLKFDRRNQPRDIAIIDRVQDVLEKIKDAMRRRSGRRNTDDMSFTDFVLEAAKILRDYNDNDLEDVYAVIDDESRSYINKERSLGEIFGHNVRRYLSSQLDVFKDIPAETLRRHLDTAIDVLENKEHTREIKEILNLGNMLYNGAGDKLKVALRNLEKARRSNGDVLGNILRSTLKSLVFDQYSNLNYDVKDNLFEMAKSFITGFTSNKETNNNYITKSTKRQAISKKREGKYALNHNVKRTTRISSGHWSDKNYKAGHKNRYIKIGPKSTSKKHNDQEIFLTKSELRKLTNTTDLLEASRHKKYNPPGPGKKYYFDSSKVKKRESNKKHESTKIKSRGPKILRGSDSSEDASDSNESRLLTGGQAVQDIYSRVDSFGDSNEQSDQIVRDKKEYSDHLLSFELLSKIGKSRSEERDYGSLTSADRSRIEDSRDREDEDLSGSEKLESGDVIMIESFESGDNVRSKVIRRSNTNDTLSLDVNPNAPENVIKLIKNIEKEIEDVKEQVEYVKHLKTGDIVEQPTFKTADSDENPSNSSNLNIHGQNNDPDSDSIERDNNEFLSDDSPEKVSTSVAFRAHEDRDNNENPDESETTENITITTVSKNTTESAVTKNGNTITKTVENNTVEFNFDVNTDNITNLNIQKDKENGNDENEVDKANDGNAVTDTSNEMKLNETDVKNTTTLLGTKIGVDENAVTENVTSAVQVKLPNN